MLFSVKCSVMNGSETVLNALDALIARIEDDIHEIEIAEADLLEDTHWYKSSRPDRRKMLEKCAEASLHRPPRTRGPHLRRIEVTDETAAKRARSAANTPLLVLVENFESDGTLLKFGVQEYATPVTWELCFGGGVGCTPPAFQIESPGGHGELPKLLKARLEEAGVRGIQPRIVVVTDSDGEWAGDVKAHARRIQEECAASGVPCSILSKRTAENYVPDAVWRAWALERQHTNAKPAIDALLRLSCHQRDHVSIGRGNSDPWDTSKAEVRALFSDVSDGDWGLLKQASLKGRGDRAIACILETHRSAFTRTEFKARDYRGDIEAVVRTIEDGL